MCDGTTGKHRRGKNLKAIILISDYLYDGGWSVPIPALRHIVYGMNVVDVELLKHSLI